MTPRTLLAALVLCGVFAANATSLALVDRNSLGAAPATPPSAFEDCGTGTLRPVPLPD